MSPITSPKVDFAYSFTPPPFLSCTPNSFCLFGPFFRPQDQKMKKTLLAIAFGLASSTAFADTGTITLQSNFVEAFTDSGVLQPISGEFYIDPGTRTEKVAFENLTLGPTQLSFQGASGSGPQVRVRMELIAGSCASSTFMIGNVNRLRRSHALEMGMGYQFEVYGRLKVQAHEHLDRSLVVLDLSEADKPTGSVTV